MFTHNIKPIVTLFAIICMGTCGAYNDGALGWSWQEEPAILALARSLDTNGLLINNDDTHVTDGDGNGPLHLVIMSSSFLDGEKLIKRKIKAAQILLNKGTQLWLANHAGETAEDLAIANNWTREQRMAAFAMLRGGIFKQQ